MPSTGSEAHQGLAPQHGALLFGDTHHAFVVLAMPHLKRHHPHPAHVKWNIGFKSAEVQVRHKPAPRSLFGQRPISVSNNHAAMSTIDVRRWCSPGTETRETPHRVWLECSKLQLATRGKTSGLVDHLSLQQPVERQTHVTSENSARLRPPIASK